MLYQKADNGKLSGRADGNVYMRNGRVRGMTVPSLVRNAYTSLARGSFSNGSSAAWAALSDAERQSWNNASGIFVSNRFGMPVEIKGKELYIRSYANCIMCGTLPPDTFPDLTNPLALTLLTVDVDITTPEIELDFLATPIPANIHAIVFATSPQKSTIYRPTQSKYRLIGSLAPADAAPSSIQVPYVLKFSQPVAGQKVFVRVKMVDARSGFESAKVDAVGIAHV